MYPDIEPFYRGWIDVSPRHSLYVERCGKQGGWPIFFLHGGPGSRIRPGHRRYFDPDFFDIVLFDQRGCGQSRPAGETADNTTRELVEDINTIRDTLGISGKISLLGGSWGSTLSLAYAMTYPEAVNAMILRGVFLGSDEEVKWYTRGLARFAPEAWEAFARDGADDLVAYYHRQVNAADPTVARQAAWQWCRYEVQIMGAPPATAASQPPADQEAMLARARIQLHYLQHHCFLEPDQLLNAAAGLQVPVTLVQGRLDLVCPPVTAYRLSRQLPQADLQLLDGAGHGADSGKLADALREAADRLRDRLRSEHEPAL